LAARGTEHRPLVARLLKREFGWSHDTALNFIRVYKVDGKFRSSSRRR